MTKYIWQNPDWPAMRWDAERLLPRFTEARFRQGRFLGVMRDIGFDARMESELAATCEDVIKTSAIEGEVLNPASVRSSIARRLGMAEGGLINNDRKVEGVVDMILDATKNFEAPLTAERIFGCKWCPTSTAILQPCILRRRRRQGCPSKWVNLSIGSTARLRAWIRCFARGLRIYGF